MEKTITTFIRTVIVLALFNGCDERTNIQNYINYDFRLKNQYDEKVTSF